MTYRIDIDRPSSGAQLSFEGLVDDAALTALTERVAAQPRPLRVVLRRGTEVDPRCIDALRRLPVDELSAESPFLARWLSESP